MPKNNVFNIQKSHFSLWARTNLVVPLLLLGLLKLLCNSLQGRWCGGPLAREALGRALIGGPLPRTPAAWAKDQGQGLWFVGAFWSQGAPCPTGPWPEGPLARGALGGGPWPWWPGGALGPGALGSGPLWRPDIHELSNQPAWTPHQPPGPGIQLPGARGPPGGGARQTLNPKP